MSDEKLKIIVPLFKLNRPIEYIVSKYNSIEWLSHVVWTKDGKTVRDYATQRFSSMMVFLSLMLGTEIGVLFSPSDPAKLIREALSTPADSYQTAEFWAGTFLTFNIIITVFGIISTFSAWAIIGALSPSNASYILRSSVGVYTCMLPSRMLLASLFLFILWLCILLIAVMTESFTIIMALAVIGLFFHIQSVYSALANLVIETGALGERQIFTVEEEEDMTPTQLSAKLIEKAHANRKRLKDEINTSTDEDKKHDVQMLPRASRRIYYSE